MWFTEAGTNQIGMINPTTHVVEEFPIDSLGNDEAEGIAVGPDQNLWFTLTGTDKIGVMNPSTHKVTEYAVPTTNAKPNAITLGPGKGSMWFTESNGYQIATITTTGKVTEYAADYEYEDPTGIVSGSDGNVWYIGTASGSLERFSAGASTAFSYASTGSDPATGITSDSSGNLWFTQENDNQVGVLSPTTDISTEFVPPSDYADPLGIALAKDNNIWFTETGYYDYEEYADAIGVIKPSNDQIAQYPTTTSYSEPSGIVSDPGDGNLWFTEEAADQIGRINPTTKALAEYPVPTKNADPTAITVDSSGNVWFTESDAARIGELSPNDPDVINEYGVPGTPEGIVAGPDGNIWFTEDVCCSGYKIGVFSPTSDTVIHQYALPSGDYPGAIIVGPDQNLWFADSSGKIGFITTGGAITEYAVPNANPVALTAGLDGNIWFTATGTYNGVQYPNIIGVVTLSTTTAPTQLAVSTQPPGAATAGNGFGLVVSVQNSAGDPDTDYTGTVSIALASNPGSDTLKGTLTEPVKNGVAVFSGLTLKQPGTGYTITATATGLTQVTTYAFNVTLGATQLNVSGEPPASVQAGTLFGLTVSAIDGQGNIDTSYTGPITLTLGNHPTGAALSGVLVLAQPTALRHSPD